MKYLPYLASNVEIDFEGGKDRYDSSVVVLSRQVKSSLSMLYIHTVMERGKKFVFCVLNNSYGDKIVIFNTLLGTHVYT